jgi:hypothetical protein
VDDYVRLEKELGITPEMVEFAEQAKTVSVAESGVFICPSDIDRMGVKVSKAIESGDRIATVKDGEFRTVYGRYLNHSDNPNAVFTQGSRNTIDAVAIRDINAWDEVTVDYRKILTPRAKRGMKEIIRSML